jgi:hypothetical protein
MLIPREESNAMNRTTEAAQVLNQRRSLRAFKHQAGHRPNLVFAGFKTFFGH